MATCAPSTGAPARAPFNPTDWLSRFESHGGAYVVANDRLHLFIVRNPGAEVNTRQAAAMLDWLTFAQHREIEDRLVHREMPEVPVNRFRALKPQAIYLIGRINQVCREHRMSASMFGRRAVRDPKFFFELLKGRGVRPETEAKVRAYIESLGKA